MYTHNRPFHIREWFLRIIMTFYHTPTDFDKLFKEFMIHEYISIKPIGDILIEKFDSSIFKGISTLSILGFIEITTYLNGDKIARITKQGKRMFYAVY